jgi:hypothetical protein
MDEEGKGSTDRWEGNGVLRGVESEQLETTDYLACTHRHGIKIDASHTLPMSINIILQSMK